MKTLQTLPVLLSVFLSASCVHKVQMSATFSPEKQDDPYTHIFPVAADSLFYPYPQRRSSSGDIGSSYSELRTQLGELDKTYRSQKPEEIMLFIHGGMTNETDGIAGALAKYRAIKSSASGSKRRIMPIFVTWNSGLFSSYQNHLGGDGNGVSYIGLSRCWGIKTLNTLFNFPTDIATGIVQTPRTWVDGTAKSFQAANWVYNMSPNSFATRSAYENTVRNHFTDGTWTSATGFFKREGDNKIPWSASLGGGDALVNGMKVVTVTAAAPVAILLAPAYQGVGRPAWENMTRRSHTLIHRYPTLIADPGEEHCGADGVLAEVMKRIAAWQNHNKSLKVTVVGHSMGTMVLNEAFRAMEPTADSEVRGKGAIPHIDIDQIIYLAAACKIRDFNDSAGDYLMRNPRTRCYNLCLHPGREVKEENLSAWFPVVLSGSLLMWIDEFFESPRDFQDRTFGSFENCIVAYRQMPRTNRFSLKAFANDSPMSGRSDSGPQKHTQFDEFYFWEKDYLDPCPPGENRKYVSIGSKPRL